MAVLSIVNRLLNGLGVKVLRGEAKLSRPKPYSHIKDTLWAIKKEVKKVIDIVPIGIDKHEYFYHRKKGVAVRN